MMESAGNAAWPWVALAGLGVFHGLNPAMGWLFAVALGLQRRSMRAVLASLVPIALGHAAAIAMVVAALSILQALVDLRVLRGSAAVVLVGFGVHRLVARHRGRAGMQVGFGDLALWSFLMATAHGAGLMLVPVLLHLPMHGDHAAHLHAGMQAGMGAAAVGMHTAAMLVTAGVAAVVVYRWVGLAFLRSGWINVDLLWAIALIATGAFLLVSTFA